VYTDVWVSMSDDPETATQRREALAPYRLDDALLDVAAPRAIALHCLPAHPGEEITAEVLYGQRERIWDQAENRRHAQKSLLELLTGGSPQRAR
jgi:ornithine carbamoyltransferase